MKIFRFEREQFIPAETKVVWDYFSDPSNLGKITPPAMNFSIISGTPAPMHEEQIIRYRVSPLPFYRTKWVTRISQVEPGISFTDEQIKGPYRLWQHHHTFSPADGGTLMRDIIHYALPLGWLGSAIGAGLVRKKLNAIFDYRREKILTLFGGAFNRPGKERDQAITLS